MVPPVIRKFEPVDFSAGFFFLVYGSQTVLVIYKKSSIKNLKKFLIGFYDFGINPKQESAIQMLVYLSENVDIFSHLS